MRTLFCLCLALSTSALAADVPLELTHQGRMLDSTGVALDGLHDVTVTLYDASAGGNVVFEETFVGTLFTEGVYGLTLGADSANPLSVETFDASGLWVGLAVDGGTELAPRPKLNAVPYAVRAATATSVSGGTVDATEISVGGSTVIASDGSIQWSSLAGAPEGLSQLADLSCSDGQTATWSGTAWTCGDLAAHTHSADDVNSGTLAIGVLPVGTTSDHVASGDHDHSADAITSGTLAVGLLPVGDSADEVAAGDHGHSAADIGALPIEGGELTGDLRLGPKGKATGFDATFPSGSVTFEASAWDSDEVASRAGFIVQARGLDCDAGECSPISPDTGPSALMIQGTNNQTVANETIIEIRDGYQDNDSITTFKGSVIFEGSVEGSNITTFSGGGVQGQILAQAACVAMVPNGGHVRAVQRTCSNSAPSCAETCAQVSGVSSCFNALHVYNNQPASGVYELGLRTYRYDSCSGNYCGPNYCCCRE